MESLTAGLMVVLGKYAMDKGIELTEKYGPVVAKKARILVLTVLDKLRKTGNGAFVADNYQKDPIVYEKPMETELTKLIAQDSTFASKLEQLLKDYHSAIDAVQPTTTISGDRNVVTQGEGNTVATNHSIAIDGNVEGNVYLGGERG